MPALVDKGGVLVVRAKPLGDLTDAIRQERDRRVSELSQRKVWHSRYPSAPAE